MATGSAGDALAVADPPSLVARVRSIGRGSRTPAWITWGALGSATALIVSRSPHLVREGRFWAEEGSVSFTHMALAPGAIADLVFVDGRAGYLNLSANLASWLAALVPLRHSPQVVVLVSMAVLLAIVWITVAWPSNLLTTTAAKVAGGLVLIVGTLAVPEVWLNSINLQTYLGLATLLLAFVAIDQVTRTRLVVGIGVLVLAGLSGLYSAVLAPVFVFAAWRERSRRRWVQAGVLCGAGAIQAGVYLQARAAETLAEKRVGPSLGTVRESVVGWHLNGFAVPGTSLGTMMRSSARGGRPVVLALVAVAVITVLVIALVSIRRRYSIMLVMSFVLAEAVVLLGSFNGVAGSRYAVVPIGIISITMIGGAAAAPRRWMRAATTGAVSVTIVVGLTQFWSASPTMIRCEGCPSWASEVTAWERGETTTLRIWPYDVEPPWQLVLAPAGAAAPGEPGSTTAPTTTSTTTTTTTTTTSIATTAVATTATSAAVASRRGDGRGRRTDGSPRRGATVDRCRRCACARPRSRCTSRARSA